MKVKTINKLIGITFVVTTILFIIGIYFSTQVLALEYRGNHRLCIIDNQNNETCLNYNETMTLNDSQSYHFILQAKTVKLNMTSIMDIFDNLFWIIALLTVFMFIWLYLGLLKLKK